MTTKTKKDYIILNKLLIINETTYSMNSILFNSFSQFSIISVETKRNIKNVIFFIYLDNCNRKIKTIKPKEAIKIYLLICSRSVIYNIHLKQ